MSLLTSAARGVVVHQAATAGEALAVATEVNFSFIILDLHLPDRSGLEILRALKALDPSPIVAVLTTHPSSQYEAESLRRGADYFFDKYNDFELVLDIARNLSGCAPAGP